LHALLNELRYSFADSLSVVDDEAFHTAIDLLAGATQVHVLSTSRSEALAAHWIYALQILGRRASAIDMHAEVAYGRWHGAASGEVLIAVLFAPYPARVLSEIHEASQRGVDVICITDRMHPRFVRDAAIVLRMPAPCGLDFDSGAVTMCMCQALLTALAARLGLYFDETVQTGEYDD
jgi:DNA-binding MurR/RpiR family transcriptional regulator